MLKYNWLLGFLFIAVSAFAQLQIKVTTVPANTPANADIYIAGNFNNWSSGDANFILTNNGDGTYQITISPAPGIVEFKFTRGDWDTVEGNANGGFQPNHSSNYNGSPSSIELPILSWEDLPSGGGSAADNVSILDKAFFLPQLNRNRRIWLYLPPDYETSNKRYPVLYMHDGQNLFDNNTSFSGEWQVDESLNQLHANGDYGVIVVGIDNGGASRIDEYSPWTIMLQGQQVGGEGDEYVDFIVNTLKPYIDSNFRSRPQREYTGIMGSSMGGLISHYAAIEYQEVFGKVGVLSPSFQYFDGAYEQVSDEGHQQSFRYYLLGGLLEGNELVNSVNSMYDTLLAAGFTAAEVERILKDDGQHSEWFWAREFPAAYQWLFSNISTSTHAPNTSANISISPNPVADIVQLSVDKTEKGLSVELYTLEGQLVVRHPLSNRTHYLDLSHLPANIYLLSLLKNQQRIVTKRLVKQ